METPCELNSICVIATAGYRAKVWPVNTCYFQQCGILTSVDSDESVSLLLSLEFLKMFSQ